MKKIFKLVFYIFIFFVFVWFLWNFSFADSWESTEKEKLKTIKQLKENIEVLKSKKVINFSIFQKFKIEHWELQNYFSKNLNSENISEIEKIISDYKKNKEIIEQKSSNKMIRLLDLEKEFYNSLLPYIDIEKINLYNTFIQKSFSTIKNEYEIKTQIKNNKKQIAKKVSKIKDKIEENNKKQQEKLNTLLEIKIKNKLLKFKNSEKIESLWKEKQKLIFNLVLKKIVLKKEKIKNLTPKQENLYFIIEKVLVEIIEEL